MSSVVIHMHLFPPFGSSLFIKRHICSFRDVSFLFGFLTDVLIENDEIICEDDLVEVARTAVRFLKEKLCLKTLN